MASLMHTWSELETPDGNYVGFVGVNGQKILGTLTDACRSALSYQGEWSDDAWNGFGLLRSPHGTYRGQFVDGERHGLGECTKTEGTVIHVLRGRFQNGAFAEPCSEESETCSPCQLDEVLSCVDAIVETLSRGAPPAQEPAQGPHDRCLDEDSLLEFLLTFIAPNAAASTEVIRRLQTLKMGCVKHAIRAHFGASSVDACSFSISDVIDSAVTRLFHTHSAPRPPAAAAAPPPLAAVVAITPPPAAAAAPPPLAAVVAITPPPAAAAAPPPPKRAAGAVAQKEPRKVARHVLSQREAVLKFLEDLLAKNRNRYSQSTARIYMSSLTEVLDDAVPGLPCVVPIDENDIVTSLQDAQDDGWAPELKKLRNGAYTSPLNLLLRHADDLLAFIDVHC